MTEMLGCMLFLQDLAGGLAFLAECERVRTPLNQYAYNIMLRMHADVGDVGGALRLLGRMRGTGALTAANSSKLGTEEANLGNTGMVKGQASQRTILRQHLLPVESTTVVRDKYTYG